MNLLDLFVSPAAAQAGGAAQGNPLMSLLPLILLFGMAAIVWIPFKKSVTGRTVYAIGASETAARFSGLPVDATKLAIYAVSGFASALAALIFVARVSTTRSDMGTGLELDVITAVVLGGTSIFGGRGTILGTALGLILVQVLENGLSLAGVKGDGTILLIGVVLIATLLVSTTRFTDSQRFAASSTLRVPSTAGRASAS